MVWYIFSLACVQEIILWVDFLPYLDFLLGHLIYRSASIFMTAQLNIVNIWLFRKQIYKGIREILFFIFIIKLISYCPSLYHEDICLFGGFVYLKSFTLIIMETSPLLVKGFKSFYILTRHSWPSSSENSSLAYHIFCDTKHPFMMVIFEDPWLQWSCHNDLGQSIFLVTVIFHLTYSLC